ncbi:MAG: carboxypeptidase M32, partial [Bacteroidota bacterium]
GLRARCCSLRKKKKHQMTYNELIAELKKITDVEAATAVLHWDKEVNLPSQGAASRSQSIATLSGIAHEMMTKKTLGEALENLNQDDSLSDKEKRNIQLALKEYRRSTKFDLDFVIKRSKVTSAAYHAWRKAREANDYSLFKDALASLIEIKKEETDILGYEGHPYNALLDVFEPEMTVAELDPLFEDVRAQITPLAAKIREQTQVNDAFFHQHFPHQKQWDFGLDVLKNMGYDFDRGRQDLSPHPFTITFSPQDVRVTTIVNENRFDAMCWSCIHEGGHALYEQGIPMEEFGTPVGRAVSLGIHESQSRLWENNVGRSKAYWTAHFPKLKEYFPEQFKDISLDELYKGMNKIQANLIRTEADEIHYHLHILVRYELEKALIEGSLAPADLKDAWNAKYKEYLDVDVPDDNQGILQDIHWAHGSIGYFPTYSLGSFYAAQFYAQAEKDISGLEDQIAKGDNSQLLDWLRVNIHQQGNLYNAKTLCKRITGEPLNLKYFVDYAKVKFGVVYGVKL